ncbi:conserved hypothetical protein [Uncinocarpus reesii 1704]|uniref:JmjC domain-containing histone demethylation protein 1 n=1 Tax=Uncinocarpus reesii (strain UAMH 1704) TaxID=336963 RepID=C4JF38_UNCRE|nr:uncharacterized protein UREG_00939 [Uncinocarpus reesii 1704]EEP76091.1 conserved hypothetical protein [Uncinocarpus reesii 1704]
MTASMSFRRLSTSRPPQYRTPSPPRHAVEPISPQAPANYRPSWDFSASDPGKASATFQHTQVMCGLDEPRESNGRPEPTAEAKPIGRVGHSRSGSNIDTLATIALATRARFAPLSYNSVSGGDTSAPSYAPVNNESTERPSKRARSERSPSPAWQRPGARPATSHNASFDSMKTDAELLLNFARPVNFPPRPQFLPAQQLSSGIPQATNMEPKWNSMPPSNIPEDESDVSNSKISAAYFAGSGTTPSRMRSRSDGAAALSRPVMNGYNSGSPKHSILMGSVLEDDTNGLDGHRKEGTLPVEDKTVLRPPKRTSKSRPRPRPSDPGVKSEGGETDSSNQASCAACNLVRVPTSNGDDAEVTWVNCDGCNRWFHIVCAGFKTDREIRTVDKFICKPCRPIHGPTTYVRKSSRPKTSIDYAGLNQGFVKPSAEAPDHHYIQPIKEGKMTFLPDRFARLPAEFVTAEYFEHGIGMTEPVVIPAHLNRRTPASALGSEGYYPNFTAASSQEEFDAIIDNLPKDDDCEEVIDCCQDLLDMVIPDNLTVRAVGELYGLDERVEVIDVKSQQGEDKRWNMQKWVEYYYDTSSTKTVRNVISLEVSQSPIGRLIRRPKIVRDLDLQDSVWPAELKAIGDYPKVQFYCLMSVADCYTDFHVDFGGSSVYYHILKGKKTFFFIPPKEKHLKKYEEWCNSAAQDTTFLGDQTKECYRVDLFEGDTMLIPSGWIHAVWTPEDSLVIGGNFLTKMNYGMQIKVAQIEKDTKVPRKFRYPFFQKLMWYAALKYLDEDPIPQSVLDAFARDENYRFHREYPLYYEFGENKNKAEPGSDYYNSRFYSQAELDGLPDLAKYLLRTALIAGGYMVDGVTKETRNAVSRSIPKGQGDPIEIIVKFGLWVAWKRGNEPAAQWTRPGAISLDTKVDISDKKRPVRPTRRSERNVNTGDRRASVVSDASKPAEGQNRENRLSTAPSLSISDKVSPVPSKRKASVPDIKFEEDHGPKIISKTTSLGPKRVACDACRKRRIRCRHKAEQNDDAMSGLATLSPDANDTQTHIRRNSDVLSIDAVNMPADDDMVVNRAGSPPDGAGALFTQQDRRCIHDESGRIDPIKAQERAKPRTGPTKRPRSSDGYLSASKKSKPNEKLDERLENPPFRTGEEEYSIVLTAGAHSGPQKKLIDNSAGYSNLENGSSRTVLEPTNGKAESDTYASPPAVNAERDAHSQPRAILGQVPPADSLVSPPTSLHDDLDGVTHQPSQAVHPSMLNERNSGYAVDVNTPTSPKTPHLTALNMTSATQDAEQTKHGVPVQVQEKLISTSTDTTSQHPKPPSRPSSSHSSKHAMTKEVKHFHTSTGTRGSPSQIRHHNTPTSPQRQSKSGKRDRVSFAEVDADEESLKLIKELQEQDFGLRKRSTRG